MKAGKIWGNTHLIEQSSNFEFHRIEFKANTCCSEHYHKTKWNGFFVETGKLLIKTWPGPDLTQKCDETFLRPGEYYRVAPGLWHQFIGVVSGVAFEIYWAELASDDIVRRTTGQVLRSKEKDELAGEHHKSTPHNDLNYDGN